MVDPSTKFELKTSPKYKIKDKNTDNETENEIPRWIRIRRRTKGKNKKPQTGVFQWRAVDN